MGKQFVKFCASEHARSNHEIKKEINKKYLSKMYRCAEQLGNDSCRYIVKKELILLLSEIKVDL